MNKHQLLHLVPVLYCKQLLLLEHFHLTSLAMMMMMTRYQTIHEYRTGHAILLLILILEVSAEFKIKIYDIWSVSVVQPHTYIYGQHNTNSTWVSR